MDSDASIERVFYYSPLSFLRAFEKQLSEDFLSGLEAGVGEGHVVRFGDKAHLFVRRLEWDSRYFKCPIHRIEFADWDQDVSDPAGALAEAMNMLRAQVSDPDEKSYLFCEIPSEDLPMLQAMGLAGARLIETRITYFHDDLKGFDRPARYKVRLATEKDIPDLRRTAMRSRNRFDRYHADPFFPESIADEYMATFVENSVRGFADLVMVPAEDDGLPGAFFTADLKPLKAISSEFDIGRIVLVAIGEERRGWHLRLLSEMSYHFKERDVRVACMTTQSTNRAVIRNCEKLGYKYGRCTHVFATHF